ncbi:hypothetical protein QNO07_04300 [Streptomyces sp. 549]|uniref:hypothetical protein n=1 Tax=Streptomyces sp. 549 TaxID=3049076 RepID=UPI0024C26803|nr:hypothetical protein [Streptomyces sp. 549]MDK1472653.1 hypothetical protein [Streptomyces sp. 549]
MSAQERKEQQVRQLMDGPRPAVPPELGSQAADIGRRRLHRRRAALAALWTVLTLATAVFCVWAAVTRPWEAPPDMVTPPLYGW